MSEGWHDVPGEPGIRLTRDGRVSKLYFNQRARAWDWRDAPLGTQKKCRYLVVSRPRTGTPAHLHRLLALTFLGHPPTAAHTFVAHNDGNARNNALSNLRWATPKENSEDRILHGNAPIGEKHALAKLRPADIKDMRRLRGVGLTYLAIGMKFGVSETAASRACRGIKWGHVT